MTNEKITDLESYKRITGAKRFKRTKEEMDLGLSPEDALQRRLEQERGGPKSNLNGESNKSRETKPNRTPRPSTSKRGDITIRIRPQAGIDSDYFEFVPDEPIEIVLDEKWFSWYHTRGEMPYAGNIQLLLEDILNLGIGEVATQKNFPDDIT
jgi:hypothetical protein